MSTTSKRALSRSPSPARKRSCPSSPSELTTDDILYSMPEIDGEYGPIINQQTLMEYQQLPHRARIQFEYSDQDNDGRSDKMQVDKDGCLINAINFCKSSKEDNTALEAIIIMAKHLKFLGNIFDVSAVWGALHEVCEAPRRAPEDPVDPLAMFYHLVVKMMGDLEERPNSAALGPDIGLLEELYPELDYPSNPDFFSLFQWFWGQVEDWNMRTVPPPEHGTETLLFNATTIADRWTTRAKDSNVHRTIGLQIIKLHECGSPACGKPIGQLGHDIGLRLYVPVFDSGRDARRGLDLKGAVLDWSDGGGANCLPEDGSDDQFDDDVASNKYLSVIAGRICLAFTHDDEEEDKENRDPEQAAAIQNNNTDEDPDPVIGTVNIPEFFDFGPFCVGTEPVRARLVALVREVYEGPPGKPKHVTYIRMRWEGTAEDFWARFSSENRRVLSEKPPWKDGIRKRRQYRNVFAMYECIPSEMGGMDVRYWA